jgi:hypothetical protein
MTKYLILALAIIVGGWWLTPLEAQLTPSRETGVLNWDSNKFQFSVSGTPVLTVASTGDITSKTLIIEKQNPGIDPTPSTSGYISWVDLNGIACYPVMHIVGNGSNLAIGSSALKSNTTGKDNLAVGTQALYSNTTGSYNLAVGIYSLDANTTGNNNLAVGYNSMTRNTTGYSNLTVGDSTAIYSTTGNSNLSVGYKSSYYRTTGSNNLSVGRFSSYYGTTGSDNVAIGGYSLENVSYGIGNIAIGYCAAESSLVDEDEDIGSSVNNIIALGAYSCRDVPNDASNIISLGYCSGTTPVSNNVYIGGFQDGVQYPLHHNWEVPAADVTAAVATASTTKLKITINRVDYYILMTTVP